MHAFSDSLFYFRLVKGNQFHTYPNILGLNGVQFDLNPTKNLQLCDKKSASVRQL